MKIFFLLFALMLNSAYAKNPEVIMETNMGVVEMELFHDKAPISVANFLKYVDAKFYDGTIFHRVINDFMIQGGGFTETFKEKKTNPPIKNESTNGLKNDLGTMAMARTNEPNSATGQFFINVKDNAFLNRAGDKPGEEGYAVFGKVTNGMHVVERIKKLKTGSRNGMTDVPMDTVLIKSIKRK